MTILCLLTNFSVANEPSLSCYLLNPHDFIKQIKQRETFPNKQASAKKDLKNKQNFGNV